MLFLQAVILPLISIIVCLVTLFLLFRYFKRSKRVLVHINLILAIVINQCFFIGTRMVKKVYHMVIINVAKEINEPKLLHYGNNNTLNESHYNPWNLGSDGSYHGLYEVRVDFCFIKISNWICQPTERSTKNVLLLTSKMERIVFNSKQLIHNKQRKVVDYKVLYFVLSLLSTISQRPDVKSIQNWSPLFILPVLPVSILNSISIWRPMFGSLCKPFI